MTTMAGKTKMTGSNPYIIKAMIPPGSDMFFGREDAYRFIDKNILPAGGGHHTLLCHGMRRTGKKSIDL